MNKYNGWKKLLRFIYQHLVLRFSGQIREPYLIRIDNIDPDPESSELLVSFHIANKRINQEMPVAEFVKKDMIYLVDPRVVFSMGQQFGSYEEKLSISKKKKHNLKSKCTAILKRV